jgi:hypothetical protein
VREDHSFNGACYGVCGQFVEPKPTSNERVTVGYEINEALTQYLDATDRRSKEEAEFKLRGILWDNKAGIVAYLLS